MGLREILKGKRTPQAVELPPIMQAQDPVNYDSVLDWLLGLSDKDYKVMLEVVEVYRNANKTSAKLLKIKDQPTTQLIEPKPTDEEVDEQLDTVLNTHPDDLKAAIEAEKPLKDKKKTQSPGKGK